MDYQDGSGPGRTERVGLLLRLQQAMLLFARFSFPVNGLWAFMQTARKRESTACV